MSENLVNALNFLWQGMLGLFVVMIVIALIVYGLGKLGAKKGNETGTQN